MTSEIDALAERRGEKPIVDRGAIETKLYHRCRECRCKLPQPAENPHKAFCCRGCHKDFHKKRCIVCEREKPTGSTVRRMLCKRSKCRNSYRQNAAQYAFSRGGTCSASNGVKSADKTGTKTGQFSGRPIRWKRLSAGPTLTPSQLLCAVVADGPDNQWAGGSIERIEASNRRALEAYFDKLDAEAVTNDFCAVCGRLDDLVDHKVGGQWVTTCRAHRQPAAAIDTGGVPSDWKPCAHPTPIDDDLEIPAFLQRGPR
jgi:hypothetical protein